MDIKDKISYIILGYLNNEYEINDFCELLIDYYEELNEESLSPSSMLWLRTLWEMCIRFSNYEEDLRLYSGVYYTEQDIREYLQNFSLDMMK